MTDLQRMSRKSGHRFSEKDMRNNKTYLTNDTTASATAFAFSTCSMCPVSGMIVTFAPAISRYNSVA
jgi:hypothetical protein